MCFLVPNLLMIECGKLIYKMKIMLSKHIRTFVAQFFNPVKESHRKLLRAYKNFKTSFYKAYSDKGNQGLHDV